MSKSSKNTKTVSYYSSPNSFPHLPCNYIQGKKMDLSKHLMCFPGPSTFLSIKGSQCEEGLPPESKCHPQHPFIIVVPFQLPQHFRLSALGHYNRLPLESLNGELISCASLHMAEDSLCAIPTIVLYLFFIL